MRYKTTQKSGSPGTAALLFGREGFTLLEIIITLTIFSVILAGVYEAYLVQLKHSTREYMAAETDMELMITRNIIERDISMAGFGLADNYGATGFNPLAALGTNSDSASDTLTLKGTACGIKSRATQAWSYVSAVSGATPTFATWNDARENLRTDLSAANNDRVILMEPATKQLLTQPGIGGAWLFRFNGNTPLTDPGGTNYGSPAVGTLAYGLQGKGDNVPTNPYYTVTYSVGGTPPQWCAAGTANLLRAESATSDAPIGGDVILPCVLDMQVTFDLDTNNDGRVDTRDKGGTSTHPNNKELGKQLKGIRLYLLAQTGNRDRAYSFPSSSIYVGDQSLGDFGRSVTLTPEQKYYHWKLLSIYIVPRNVR